MVDLKQITEEVQQLSGLVRGLLEEVATSLHESASEGSKRLPPDEVLRRFAAAARELRGHNASAPVAAAAQQLPGGDTSSKPVVAEHPEAPTPEPIKFTTHYFEGKSVKELSVAIDQWQEANKTRLVLTNIQRDDDKFCCIAQSGPTEVKVVNKTLDVVAHQTPNEEWRVVASQDGIWDVQATQDGTWDVNASQNGGWDVTIH